MPGRHPARRLLPVPGAQGPRAELLERGGLYAAWYEQQFKAHAQLPGRETTLI